MKYIKEFILRFLSNVHWWINSTVNSFRKILNNIASPDEDKAKSEKQEVKASRKAWVFTILCVLITVLIILGIFFLFFIFYFYVYVIFTMSPVIWVILFIIVSLFFLRFVNALRVIEDK